MMVNWLTDLNFLKFSQISWQISYQPTHVVEQFPLLNIDHKCSSYAIDSAPTFLFKYVRQGWEERFFDRSYTCPAAERAILVRGKRPLPRSMSTGTEFHVSRFCVDVYWASMRTSNNQSSIAVLLSHIKHPVNSRTAAKTSHNDDDNHKYTKHTETHKKKLY